MVIHTVAVRMPPTLIGLPFLGAGKIWWHSVILSSACNLWNVGFLHLCFAFAGSSCSCSLALLCWSVLLSRTLHFGPGAKVQNNQRGGEIPGQWKHFWAYLRLFVRLTLLQSVTLVGYNLGWQSCVVDPATSVQNLSSRRAFCQLQCGWVFARLTVIVGCTNTTWWRFSVYLGCGVIIE